MSRMRGVNKLRRTLRRIEPETTAEVRDAMADAAQAILYDAQRLVPVDEGTLKANLSAKTSRDGLTAKIGVRGKRANRKAYYAKFVEFGTVNAPAKPFLEPAFEMNRREIQRNIRAAISRALKKASRLG